MALLSIAICLQYSCQKDATTTTSASTVLDQFYTIGAKQKAADMIRTTDGGYLMVGTSYPTASSVEGDIVAIKVDSLGIQQWHTLMGKAAGPGSGNLAGMHVKYHEKGVKVAALPDGSGYTIAANRTYVAYATPSSATGFTKQTKVVFYNIDNAGIATSTDGQELRSSTAFTDRIADFKIDDSNGALKYILTGYTSDVQASKPLGTHTLANDLTDVFTVLLDDNFTPLWSSGSLAYGFSREDYGTSIQVLPNSYLVIGTSEEILPSAGTYHSRFLAVQLNKDNGIPINPVYLGDPSYQLEGGYSTYDASSQTITAVGNVLGGTSAYTGQLAVFQLDLNLNIQTPNPTSIGCLFIRPTAPTSTSINNRFQAQSIAPIPNNGGFLISSTMVDNIGKDICISKLNANLILPSANWPYYYGYTTGHMASLGHEIAATVLPVLENNSLTGYAFTGTFKSNTNASEIGWVRF